MHEKKFLVLFLISSIFLSGCPEGNPDYGGPGPDDGTHKQHYDSGDQNPNSVGCGDFEQPCCEWAGTDEFGVPTARVYCNDGLECRADVCVEGPDYQSAGRPYN